jgi:hypothetical protein
MDEYLSVSYHFKISAKYLFAQNWLLVLTQIVELNRQAGQKFPGISLDQCTTNLTGTPIVFNMPVTVAIHNMLKKLLR